MSALDIANVELLTIDDLVESVGLPLDVPDLQHRIDDLVGYGTVELIDPKEFEVRNDTIPLSAALKPMRFRSSL